MKNKIIQIVVAGIFLLSISSNSVHAESNSNVQEAENRGVAKMMEKGKIGSDWEALARARSLQPASQEMRQARYSEVVTYLNTANRLASTDYARTLIGLVAIGADPTSIPEATTHKNLVAEMYQNKNLLNEGINSIIYSLIALETKSYTVPDDAAFTLDQLVDRLCSLQKADGGWALFGTKSDVDITGMVMTSLANHRDKPAVQESINKAARYLADVQEPSGGYKSAGFWGEENSNTIAQALMGLTSNQINPMDPMYTKDATMVEAVLTYQLADGGFKWVATDTTNNGAALEQVIYALAQYRFFQEGKGSIYNFEKNPVPLLTQSEAKPTPDPKPEPNPIPEPVEKTPLPIPESGYYTVAAGDTLALIATCFGLTIEDIRSWNHLENDEVMVGQRLSLVEPVIEFPKEEETVQAQVPQKNESEPLATSQQNQEKQVTTQSKMALPKTGEKITWQNHGLNVGLFLIGTSGIVLSRRKKA
ncbi:LysM peptidoglycan-binding domain-containing protein [Carnobacterium divergens]|uniref:Uncharacterized protein n=1 Tax=Carnobacterium divergens TaxID=2748 RepID=A0A7Z8CYM5_CARDV|nr:LysM peptidoglycan-binding domain-containing protein [Carnobacterium divergens]TFI71794.1 hypothetical protein CKN58_09140 [Carnobacterium divergens]TFI76643.1 hypothetical protein CKN85_09195 [Carnobacterium divergens]TFI82471.1 hypothetical protein CKN56_09220 [Carnobacterium divergens]TFI94643.1 hypothetical protein CKN64_09160 [Carnobacterium divergens]TFJ11162.1 hypothetical protein CKN60_09190 [Carnobacterium divergens]